MIHDIKCCLNVKVPLSSGDTVANGKVQQYGAFNAKLFYKQTAYRAESSKEVD